jgi:hypothetical protein
MTYRLFPLLILILFASSAVQAEDGVEEQLSPEIAVLQLQQELRSLRQSNQVYEEAMKNLIRRIELLEDQQADNGVKKPAVSDSLSPELAAKLQKESEENYSLIQAAFEQRLNKEGSMLLPAGNFIYELGFSFAHASYDKIAVDGFTVFPVLVVGNIVSEQVRRDIVMNNHSFRAGLPFDMQFDLFVPFGYEHEQTFREDGTYDEDETDGLGDISLALSHQLVNAHDFWPDTLVGINWKSTSGQDPYRLVSADEPALGTGFQTWGASMTMLTTSDPIVVFGGLSGTYTQQDRKSIGLVKPGESFGLNLGMALALNLDTSLSFNYQYQHTLEAEIERQDIRGSDVQTSMFTIGLSKAKGSLYAVDVDLAIGLTRDTPDFQLTLAFPFRFSL